MQNNLNTFLTVFGLVVIMSMFSNILSSIEYHNVNNQDVPIISAFDG